MQENYIPLYRKYRPQTFADLIGQENLVNTLSNAIKLNKIAHAYLFCGPRGTGKTSSARIFAKSLNCINGPTLEPCGKCPSCINITNSTPIDVIEIDGASNRNVEHAQSILEKIQYAPVDGKYKIYIIDEVHMLSNTAFNALLKTLEEPPKNVIFILATTEIHKVLDTIISRCQRFDFRRITTDDIVKRLEYVATQEKIQISTDALYNIAKSSQGGMRDSLALLDQVSILGLTKEIQSTDIDEILGKISIQELFELVEDFKNTNSQDALLKTNKIYEKGIEPAQIIENLTQYLRDLLIIKNTKENKIVLEISKLNDHDIDKMRPQSEFFDNEVLIYMLDKLMYYLKRIKDSSNRHLFLELAIIELANNNNYYSYQELIDKIQKLEANGISANQVISSKPMNLPKPKIMQEKQVAEEKTQPVESKETITETKQQEKPEIIQEEIKKEVTIEKPEIQINTIQNGNWKELLDNIDSIPSKMFFNNLAKPIEINSEKIVIGFQKDLFVKQAKDDAKKTPLENAAKKYFNVNSIIVDIQLLSESSKILREKPPKENKIIKQEEPKEDLNNNDDNEYYENLLNEKKQELNENKTQHSDGSKMVQELFDGKYL